MRGRRIFYSGAIGTEPLLAEVILDQVADFDTRHGIETSSVVAKQESRIEKQLKEWLEQGSLQIGEVVVQTTESGWVLSHVADAEAAASKNGDLMITTQAEDARQLARNTAGGKFRPLHSAPTLKRNWAMRLESLSAVRLALDYFYPSALGVWLGYAAGKVSGTPLRHYLGRQTGMYRFANGITDEQAHAMAACECATPKCLRRIVWPLDESTVIGGAAEEKVSDTAGYANESYPGSTRVPLLCVEPCPVIVGAARKLARANHEAREAAAKAASTV